MPDNSPASFTTGDFVCPTCIIAYRTTLCPGGESTPCRLTAAQHDAFLSLLKDSPIGKAGIKADSNAKWWLNHGHIPGLYKIDDPIFTRQPWLLHNEHQIPSRPTNLVVLPLLDMHGSGIYHQHWIYLDSDPEGV